jgi:hypothetical protein
MLRAIRNALLAKQRGIRKGRGGGEGELGHGFSSSKVGGGGDTV